MKKVKIVLSALCLLLLIGGWQYLQKKYLQVDLEAPIIRINESVITVSINATDEQLIEGVTAEDNIDGDVSDSILIENVVKKSGGGANEFLITYVAFDSSNNVGRMSRDLIYSDYRQPHFELTGLLRFPNNKKISLFDYIQANDCLDGNITSFITIEGEKELEENMKEGIYDYNLSVVNSVGDIAELPIQVEVYEDSYEEQNFRPKILLQSYLEYLEKGSRFNPEDYLDHIIDGGTWLIDYGPMISIERDGESSMVTEKMAKEEKGNWINISQIRIKSNVDTNNPGIYHVTYSYTSDDSGYECKTQMIVVVE
ncbi:MAG: DUF5011 domain-containing protein [Eubacterium sp.]|nr:DUF5011 domain-containing protein [Eubacterium sp.]